MKMIITAVLTSGLMSSVAWADSCDYSRDINFDVDASGLEQVILDLGAGHLVVGQAENVNQVSVRARACADSRRRLESTDLVQNRRGDRLTISSDIEDSLSFSLFNEDYAYIDVDILLPPGLVLEIEDGSGEVRIDGVEAELRIEDGSGDISIRRHQGLVEIDDGSGSIDLDDIAGAVWLVDGSGDIDVHHVSGNVHVPSDGSGSIRIRDVRGNVMIDDDGSGSISVHSITGDMTVGDAGSGSVNYGDIGGSVRLD